MKKDLQLPLTFFTLYLAWGIKETIALPSKPDRAKMKREKAIVNLDGKVIDMAFVMLIKEDDLDNWEVDTAMAYAKTLQQPLRQIAITRIQKYEAWLNGKMTLQKIREWMSDFKLNPDKHPEYKKMLEEWNIS